MNDAHKYAIGAVLGVVFFCTFISWIGDTFERVAAQHCINTGKIVLADRVFECKEIGKAVNL